MDTNAIDAHASHAMPPPIPQYVHFPAKERLYNREQHVKFLMLVFLLIAVADSAGYLSHCLVTGISPDASGVLLSFGQWFIYWVAFSAQALWFIPSHVVKDCRILGDRFVQTFPHSWKEFSIKQLENVVLYEDENKVPLLVHLKFRGHRRVLVDDLVDMPKFVASLHASMPADAAFETKPHMGMRHVAKFLPFWIAALLGWAFAKHYLPDAINLVLVISFLLLVIAFIAAFIKDPSFGRVKFGPFDH